MANLVGGEDDDDLESGFLQDVGLGVLEDEITEEEAEIATSMFEIIPEGSSIKGFSV